jgi:4-alpha-glucanotransferase
MSVDDRVRAISEPSLTPSVRTTLLEALCASRSNLLILPIQDVFGWRARINQPATVGDQNWTWKLPWPSDRLLTQPEAIGVALQLRDCAERHGR